VILSFRPGREAAKHNVYLSTDEQAVIDGTVPVATVTEPSYASSLDLAGTYFWRIDEVNDAEIPTTWQGDIWNLSTQEYLVVDDFESYNDIDAGQEGSNLVYGTWIDGFGTTTNGSTIGYFEAFQPSMENTLVYDGSQSVPLFYDNTVATYSEVTANIADLQASQDWAKHGIKALTLHFYGDPNNSVNEQMYVKLNGSKVTYAGDAENLNRIGWQMWYVDLASIGVSLSNVTELSIGFERTGAVGGRGVVYLDGIRLCSYDRQEITPVDPDPTGLQAHYEFEGTYSDSSGNARHGTAMGNPAFVAGEVGQAINLDGVDDYVQITGYKGILGPNAVTVTAWVRTTSTGTADTGSNSTNAIVGWGPNVAGQRFGFRVDAGRLRAEHHGGNVQGDSSMNDGGWHHVAVTVQENATVSYPDVILYLDGMNDTRPTTDLDPVFNLTAAEDLRIGSRPASNDRFFQGQIDEVRIYDRALTQEEIAWLSGRTLPFDKPF
ncbi:MAG TPA: LamG domain-containing protein, partial [Sedimentisphaerales bacterium]|nr:LamG domain-containing protein [Sedimentisphaerales bacterium]